MRFIVFLVLIFFNSYTKEVSASDYILDVGDKIEIFVYGELDLTRKLKISKSGLVSFPFVEDIQVIGLTVKDIEKIIHEGLLGDYLVNPQVSVLIVEYRPFFIHGQVFRPGGIPYQEDLRFDKAIALAGGLTNRASKDDWKITRVIDGKSVVIEADITTPVKPDDIIEIGRSFF